MRKIIKHLLLSATLLLGGRIPSAIVESGERVLEDAGLDPTLVAKWAPDRQVIVFNGSPASRQELVEILAEGKSPIGHVELYNRIAMSSRDTKVARFNGYCVMYINERLIHDGDLEGFGIHPETRRRWTLLHELRHCSPENVAFKSKTVEEYDADVHAVRALRNAGLSDDQLEGLTLARSYTSVFFDGEADEHDTTLVLDAIRQRRREPSVWENQEINNEAMPVMRRLKEQRTLMRDDYCEPGPQRPAACFYDAAGDTRKLSASAQRRVELYRQSLDRKFPL